MMEMVRRIYSLTIPEEFLLKISENIYKFIEASKILEYDFVEDNVPEE